MMFRQLFRDVILIIAFEILDTLVINEHFDVHVGYAKAEDVIFVLWVGDLRNGVVQQIVSYLIVEVVVSVFVQLMQIRELWNLIKRKLCNLNRIRENELSVKTRFSSLLSSIKKVFHSP